MSIEKLTRRQLLSGVSASLTLVVTGNLNIAGVTAASPNENETTSTDCEYKLGFKIIADQIPQIVGQCRTKEDYGSNGDSLQLTTGVDGKGGLLAWRKSDNWTAYTNGYNTWVNGPNGIQKRLNTERFSWENDPIAPVEKPPANNFPPALNMNSTDIVNQFISGGDRHKTEIANGANSKYYNAVGPVIDYRLEGKQLIVDMLLDNSGNTTPIVIDFNRSDANLEFRPLQGQGYSRLYNTSDANIALEAMKNYLPKPHYAQFVICVEGVNSTKNSAMVYWW